MIALQFAAAGLAVLVVAAGMVFLAMNLAILGLHWVEVAYAIVTQG